jgi:hypothetical protein
MIMRDLMRYLERLPKTIPPGRILVHNFPPSPEQANCLGLNGFRAFTVPETVKEGFKKCSCGWSGLEHCTTHENHYSRPASN